jgi:hypothetical protein
MWLFYDDFSHATKGSTKIMWQKFLHGSMNIVIVENNFGKTSIKYGIDICKQGFRRRETAFSSWLRV